MQVNLTPDLRKKYPESKFGSLIIRGVPNKKTHAILEGRKRDLEERIREDTRGIKNLDMIRYYNSYFKMWKKIYPIEYQLKTIKKGGQFPRVSVLVDSMFVAELYNMVLTSGHDLDTIQGDLTFDISKGGEKYMKINGQDQELKNGDILLKDEEGILACILYGPARRTSITLSTKNALFFAWYPQAIKEENIKAHLKEILMNVNNVFTNATSEVHVTHP